MEQKKAVTLRRLVRHAELYGCDLIYEVAIDAGLSADELGSLARRLPNIDKGWKLSRDDAASLALKLIQAGMPDRDILDTCRISRPTLAKVHSRAAESESFGQSQPVGRIPGFFHIEALRTAPMEVAA